MLFPIGSSEHDGIIGWYSVGIMVSLVVIHLLVSSGMKNADLRYSDAIQQAIELKTDSLADNATSLDDDFSDEEFSQYDYSNSQEDQLQALLDAMSGEDDDVYLSPDEYERVAHEVMKTTPIYIFGIVPGDMKWWQLLTHMFLHGSWGHLIGNLIFFYIAAIMLERYWGPGKFLGLYVLIGIIAGMGHLIFTTMEGNGNSLTPLIGASGAIAGAMGAFMIIFRKAKIKFMFFFGFRIYFFDIGVWWYFGFWLAQQIFYLVLNFGSDGGGVAFTAHVVGFAAGVGTAFIVPGLDINGNLVTGFERSNAKPERSRFEEKPVHDRNMSLADRKAAADQGGLIGGLAPIHVKSVMDDAWSTYSRENPQQSQNSFVAAVDNLIQQEANNPERIQKELAKFFTIHNQLGIDPNHYYHWGRKLQYIGQLPDAVRCYEWGATKTTDINIRCKSLLLAAGIRGDLGDNFALAGKQVQYVIQNGPSAPVQSEAQHLMEKLKQQYQAAQVVPPPPPAQDPIQSNNIL